MKKTSLLANVLPVGWLVLLVAFGLPTVLAPVMLARVAYLVARDGA